jgi:hypothetical protein
MAFREWKAKRCTNENQHIGKSPSFTLIKDRASIMHFERKKLSQCAMYSVNKERVIHCDVFDAVVSF